MPVFRELTTDELSAARGGATNSNNSPPPPVPSPVDVIVKWIFSHLR
jgi:hypothetical protein